MTDIKVYFMHPTDGRLITVTVDNSMTTQEAIGELISNDFIAPNPQGYNLAIKGGDQLRSDQSFDDARVKEGNVIRVIPVTDAGGGCMISSLGNLPIDDNLRFYIFMIGGNAWAGSINEIILNNFENIAREIGPNASIVKGFEEPFWSDEVIEKYLGKKYSNIVSYLPALLITNAHPQKLTEDSLRLLIALREIKSNFSDFDAFFNSLVQFIRYGDSSFLLKFDDRANTVDTIMDAIDIKPNFFGLGININNLLKRFRRT